MTCRYVVVGRQPQGAEPEYDAAFTDTWGVGDADDAVEDRGSPTDAEDPDEQPAARSAAAATRIRVRIDPRYAGQGTFHGRKHPREALCDRRPVRDDLPRYSQ